MAVRRQKSLVLILAREFASQLAMPMFVADGDGTLIFYNEAAERILGRSFAEVGELTAGELVDTFDIENLEGESLAPEERALGIAFFERRPTHGNRRVKGVDGLWRTIAVTAFPLMTGHDELDGVVAIFWENGEDA
ncbi:MAG TPA: PAS domain-containing protein [Gaiellaceae bacterium]|nr:PAS domain-containing protein [Gaiellaceae bacterium]